MPRTNRIISAALSASVLILPSRRTSKLTLNNVGGLSWRPSGKWRHLANDVSILFAKGFYTSLLRPPFGRLSSDSHTGKLPEFNFNIHDETSQGVFNFAAQAEAANDAHQDTAINASPRSLGLFSVKTPVYNDTMDMGLDGSASSKPADLQSGPVQEAGAVIDNAAPAEAIGDLTQEQEVKLVRSALRSSLDGEDAELLNDFLLRAKAKRAAKAAHTDSGCLCNLPARRSLRSNAQPHDRVGRWRSLIRILLPLSNCRSRLVNSTLPVPKPRMRLSRTSRKRLHLQALPVVAALALRPRPQMSLLCATLSRSAVLKERSSFSYSAPRPRRWLWPRSETPESTRANLYSLMSLLRFWLSSQRSLKPMTSMPA